MQAVILAAGQGLRLRPLTETTPKALVSVCGTPLLFHILASLPDAVQEIFIVVGHLKEQIMNAVGDEWHGKPVRFVTQHPLDGTGHALHLLHTELHDKFIVVNGDDLYAKQDLERLTVHEMAMLVIPTTDSSVSSALRDTNGNFIGLETNAPASEIKWRVCGAYVLDPRFFRYPLATVFVHDRIEYSLPHTIVEMTKDITIKTEEATRWYPVGTQTELAAAEATCG